MEVIKISVYSMSQVMSTHKPLTVMHIGLLITVVHILEVFIMVVLTICLYADMLDL